MFFPPFDSTLSQGANIPSTVRDFLQTTLQLNDSLFEKKPKITIDVYKDRLLQCVRNTFQNLNKHYREKIVASELPTYHFDFTSNALSSYVRDLEGVTRDEFDRKLTKDRKIYEGTRQQVWVDRKRKFDQLILDLNAEIEAQKQATETALQLHVIEDLNQRKQKLGTSLQKLSDGVSALSYRHIYEVGDIRGFSPIFTALSKESDAAEEIYRSIDGNYHVEILDNTGLEYEKISQQAREFHDMRSRYLSMKRQARETVQEAEVRLVEFLEKDIQALKDLVQVYESKFDLLYHRLSRNADLGHVMGVFEMSNEELERTISSLYSMERAPYWTDWLEPVQRYLGCTGGVPLGFGTLCKDFQRMDELYLKVSGALQSKNPWRFPDSIFEKLKKHKRVVDSIAENKIILSFVPRLAKLLAPDIKKSQIRGNLKDLKISVILGKFWYEPHETYYPEHLRKWLPTNLEIRRREEVRREEVRREEVPDLPHVVDELTVAPKGGFCQRVRLILPCLFKQELQLSSQAASFTGLSPVAVY